MGVDGVGWLEERGLSARLVSEAGEVTTVGDWPREEGDPPHPDAPPPGGRELK
jgi:hypothetical protein